MAGKVLGCAGNLVNGFSMVLVSGVITYPYTPLISNSHPMEKILVGWFT